MDNKIKVIVLSALGMLLKSTFVSSMPFEHMVLANIPTGLIEAAGTNHS